MATVAEMVAVLRADTTQFSAAMVKAEGEVKGLGATAGESSKIASKAFLVMGAAAVVGIGLAIDQTVKFARETKSLQRITGDSALATSSLISGAATLGVSAEKLTVSFGLLQKNISSNSKAWQLWGVETTDASGKALPFSVILGELADKFVALGGAGTQASAMVKAIFGRGGTALMPLLAQGAAGIKQLTDEAIHMGAALTTNQLASALNLSVQIRTMGESFKGAAISIGVQFLPVATAVLHWIADALGWFARLPGPIKAVGLSVMVLLGAFVLLGKAWTFFSGLFAPTIAKIAVLGGAEAVTTDTTVLLTEAIDRLSLSMGTGLAAGAAEGEASLATFTAAEVGMPGTIGAANTAIYTQTSALGALASGLGTVAFVAVGAVAAFGAWKALVKTGGTLAGGLPLLGAERGTGAGTGAASTGTGLGLGLTSKQAVRYEAERQYGSWGTPLGDKLQARTVAVGLDNLKGLGANSPKMISDTKALANATAEWTAQTKALAASQDQAMTVAQRTAAATNQLGTAFAISGGAMKDFAAISGQSMDGVQTAMDAYAAEMNKQPPDAEVLATNAHAALSGMQDAWSNWSSSLQQTLNQTGNAMQAFSGQKIIDPKKLQASLNQSIKDTRSFSSDIMKITNSGVKGIGDQIQPLMQMGPQYAAAFIRADGTVRTHLVATFVKAQTAGSGMAGRIASALDPVFQHFIDQMEILVSKLDGTYTPKVDNSQALAAIQAIIDKAANIPGSTYSSGPGAGHAPGQGGSGGSGGGGSGSGGGGGTYGGHRTGASGGIFGMAIGGITQGSVFMLGEGASSTFAGRGAEAVIPLNSRGIGILAEAVRQGTGGAPDVKVLVRPDRRRFNRDLSWDYQTRGL